MVTIVSTSENFTYRRRSYFTVPSTTRLSNVHSLWIRVFGKTIGIFEISATAPVNRIFDIIGSIVILLSDII